MSVGTESVQDASISVYFQIGLFKERVKVPKGRLSFKSVKKVAAEIIEKKVGKCLIYLFFNHLCLCLFYCHCIPNMVFILFEHPIYYSRVGVSILIGQEVFVNYSSSD